MSTYATAKVAPLIRRWMQGQGTREAYTALAELSGVSHMTIGRIVRQETDSVRVGTLDKLLVAIDRPDAWHVELAER